MRPSLKVLEPALPGRIVDEALTVLERTGVLSGRREFNGKDWYTRGAAFLLKEQLAEGQWDDDTCMDPELSFGTGNMGGDSLCQRRNATRDAVIEKRAKTS